MALRGFAATRYVEALREGGSLPGLMEADDDGLYVTKFRGAGQGEAALVAEVLAGELARALGLPVPDLAVVDGVEFEGGKGEDVELVVGQSRFIPGFVEGLAGAKAGEERSVELTVTPLKGQKGDLVGTVIVVRDVSELRGITKQMSYQASHDALTGLVNRREFERRLEEALATAHTNEARHVLCYLDLDRFKDVNDTCGHMAGDGMLREVAALMPKTPLPQ